MEKILYKIKHSKNIQITPEAENFVLNISNNNIKTLINYMEKFSLINEEICFELANKACTNISFIILEEYTNLLKQNRLNDAIKVVYDIYDKGASVMDILDNYFIFIKTTKIISESEKYEIIPLICKYITIFHNIHEDEIELALFTNNIINSIYDKNTTI
jgi:DNA polymerase III delta subunit